MLEWLFATNNEVISLLVEYIPDCAGKETDELLLIETSGYKLLPAHSPVLVRVHLVKCGFGDEVGCFNIRVLLL